MKRQDTCTSNLFIYSNEEDSFIEKTQIIECLSSPTMDNQNRYSFQQKFEAESIIAVAVAHNLPCRRIASRHFLLWLRVHVTVLNVVV